MEGKNNLKESILKDSFSENLSNSEMKDASLKKKYLAGSKYLGGGNMVSILLFSWISPLLSYGSKFYLE
jgi:hypothetical protein